MRVEDGQERDRLDRRREQADGTVEQPRARYVQQPQRRRAEQRGGHAGEGVDPGGVQRERADRPGCAPIPEREQEVQQVRERGRIREVVRVERPLLEHFDRVRHEMLGLVDVVRVGQPLPHTPQAQPQARRAAPQ
jgi:hypothetical protein